MALSIVNNSTAIGAQGSVNKANSALAKTIKSLSTGLRINSAADDASGLAVSEKLRGQISGLSKASLNAQDAISMLQTAEGAMGSMTSMVQRIRELAVQSGDPAYTANDRAMLQLEVDQLKEEINRVSSSTEFNTKKLLNGDASGLWSATSQNIEAILKGSPAEGNYKIDYALTGGTNNVYKTDVMTADMAKLSDIEYSLTGNSFNEFHSTTSISGSLTFDNDIDYSDITAQKTIDNSTSAANIEIKSGTGTLMAKDKSFAITVKFLDDILDLPGAGTEITGKGLKAEVEYTDLRTGIIKKEVVNINSGQAQGDLIIGATAQENDFGTGLFGLKIGADGVKKGETASFIYVNGGNAQAAIGNNSYNTKLDIGVEDKKGNTVDISLGTYTDKNGNFELYVPKFKNGRFTTEFVKGNVSIDATTQRGSFIGKEVQNAASLPISDITGTPGIKGTIEYSDKATLKSKGNEFIIKGSNIANTILRDINFGTNQTDLGKMNGTYAMNFKITDTDKLEGKITYTNLETGAQGTVDVKYAKEGTDKINIVGASNGANAAATGISFQFDSTSALSNGDSVGFILNGDNKKSNNNLSVNIDGAKIYTDAELGKKNTVYAAKFDDKGNFNTEKIEISLKDEIKESGIMKFDTTKEERVASQETLLKDLKVFTNADGRNVLDNTQELTLYNNNGDKKTIFLEGNDTVGTLQDKLTQAMVDLGLGGNTGDTELDKKINESLVQFVEDGTEMAGNKAVPGTFIIQGAAAGDDSKISFVGDQNILNAFSLTNIQKGENATLDVTVSDAHSGSVAGNKILYSGKVGNDEISDGILRGVVDGVDIKIDMASGSKVGIDSKGDITFNKDPKTGKSLIQENTEFLHIVNNGTKAAIGANEGQVLDLSIGRLDTTALEINDVNVSTFENAQKSITKLDMALEKISKARATAGAQMNRLEYTIENLNTSRENMVAAESRIRDLDIAATSSQLAAQQVVLQSATAMLAQANQLPSYAMQLLG